ncbi:MAG TPA: hypothetical protein PLK90_08365 [Clostridiales bacterium]|nr:hypothetical protein [Clostridiales bacterium]HQP70395.1 hypothetical protein [Clostridiales bacterium]
MKNNHKISFIKPVPYAVPDLRFCNIYCFKEIIMPDDRIGNIGDSWTYCVIDSQEIFYNPLCKSNGDYSYEC